MTRRAILWIIERAVYWTVRAVAEVGERISPGFATRLKRDLLAASDYLGFVIDVKTDIDALTDPNNPATLSTGEDL